jgi:hypothetical protein
MARVQYLVSNESGNESERGGNPMDFLALMLRGRWFSMLASATPSRGKRAGYSAGSRNEDRGSGAKNQSFSESVV